LELARKETLRAGNRIFERGGVGRNALALAGRIVEAMGGAVVEADRDVAAERAAPLHQGAAATGGNLLVVRAVEHPHGRIGPIAVLEAALEAAGWVERERGAEGRLRHRRLDAWCLDGHGC